MKKATICSLAVLCAALFVAVPTTMAQTSSAETLESLTRQVRLLVEEVTILKERITVLEEQLKDREPTTTERDDDSAKSMERTVQVKSIDKGAKSVDHARINEIETSITSNDKQIDAMEAERRKLTECRHVPLCSRVSKEKREECELARSRRTTMLRQEITKLSTENRHMTAEKKKLEREAAQEIYTLRAVSGERTYVLRCSRIPIGLDTGMWVRFRGRPLDAEEDGVQVWNVTKIDPVDPPAETIADGQTSH